MAIPESVRDRASNLSDSRIVPLEESLTYDMSSKTQELVSSGMTHTSVRVTEMMGIARRNLEKRASVIAETIKEVCTSQGVTYSDDLADELTELFNQIYERHVKSVRERFDKVVPDDQFKRMCKTGRLAPDVTRYSQELGLFADGFKRPTPLPDYRDKVTKWFWSKPWSVIVYILVIGLPALVGWVVMLKTLLQWMGSQPS